MKMLFQLSQQIPETTHSHKMLALKIIKFIYIFSLALRFGNAVVCPVNCKCAWILDSLEVDCSRSGLIDYPVLKDIPVEHFDLSMNNFVEFPKQFADIESLLYLDLSNNQIEFIDADALLGFNALRTLLLANNSIVSWASINPNEAFLHAISLERLGLSGNRLEVFTAADPKLTLRSDSLTHLELERCDITTVGGDHLINGLPNLERLSLSNNALATLNALPSKTLRVLELSNCKLSTFGNAILSHLPNLQALNVSSNMGLQIGVRGSDPIFSNTLTELDASACNLDDIDLSALPGLITLHLRTNILREITPKTFANNTQLELLDLSRNSIRFIAADAFVHLKRLNKLDLSYNQIARLDRTVFRSNDVLVSLDLSRNVFETLPKLVSNSLRDINLSWCEIVAIDSSALSGLSTIQRLHLSNNLLKEFPSGMRSETLQEINLSSCKLTALRNNSLRGFSELATLRLNGNRFTNPFAVEIFNENKYLDRIWLGDNPWICNCNDYVFIEFYEYLTTKPSKLQDKFNVRCVSPTLQYGLTWESACRSVWIPSASKSTSGTIFSTFIFVLLSVGILWIVIAFLRTLMKKRKERNNRREYRSNQAEMQAIRCENQRILQMEGAPNAPSPYENLPSYEDALLMPKLERPTKSMVDLTASARARKKFERSRTDPERNANTIEEDNELLVDIHHRFRSEEMLSNRDKERTAQINPYRRVYNIEHNNSGSRRFSIENSRFVAAHFKAQNLQSAEQIANFQSYENSPYTKRRAKIAEIPPFKRATLIANSVEFLTDPEFEAESSKPASPFAQRKPKTPTTPPAKQPPISTSISAQKPENENFYANLTILAPAIEDHFASGEKSSASSSLGSNFDMIVEKEVASLADQSGASTTDEESTEFTRNKRRKRKNSSHRASGNFTSAATSAANETSSSDSEPAVLIHRPLKETIF